MAGLALVCAAALGGEHGLVPQARAANAANSAALEQRVKAAFLYKFLGYAEFPAGAFADGASPVVIGVFGADDLAAELGRIASGRTVNGRPIVVRVLRESELAMSVHLLFIGGFDAGRVGRSVRSAGGALLVVTECDAGLQQGSAINFRVVDERVRFDVALDAAERKGIKLSSRLLTVANRVQRGAQQ
jgi:hypothetical protein